MLTNHPVPSTLISSVYREWRLHGSPSENPDLSKYYHSPDVQDGYFPMAVSEKAKGATVKDLKHYFQLYFPHGKYPDEADVSGDARQLWTELTALGRTLVGWIDDHMPADVRRSIQQKIGEGRTLSECVSEQCTMLRVLHYPGYADAEVEAGAVRPLMKTSTSSQCCRPARLVGCGSSRTDGSVVRGAVGGGRS